MITGNEPAYPLNEETSDRVNEGISIYTGLTIRHHFSAMAMQGILCQLRADVVTAKMQAEYYAKEYPNMTMFEAVAAESIQQADALIAELNKTE